MQKDVRPYGKVENKTAPILHKLRGCLRNEPRETLAQSAPQKAASPQAANTNSEARRPAFSLVRITSSRTERDLRVLRNAQRLNFRKERRRNVYLTQLNASKTPRGILNARSVQSISPLRGGEAMHESPAGPSNNGRRQKSPCVSQRRGF